LIAARWEGDDLPRLEYTVRTLKRQRFIPPSDFSDDLLFAHVRPNAVATATELVTGAMGLHLEPK
jgi:hypothetical protein